MQQGHGGGGDPHLQEPREERGGADALRAARSGGAPEGDAAEERGEHEREGLAGRPDGQEQGAVPEHFEAEGDRARQGRREEQEHARGNRRRGEREITARLRFEPLERLRPDRTRDAHRDQRGGGVHRGGEEDRAGHPEPGQEDHPRGERPPPTAPAVFAA